MSAYSVVDGNGNINSEKLSKELKDALEFDVRYKQTDNMKKRAVKVAGDYKEFKEMVAAAHLKKLSKTEVESLSQVKRGWQKSVVKDGSTAAHILSKEQEEERILRVNQDFQLSNPSSAFSAGKIGDSSVLKRKKPRTAMEIERDLHRCASQEDKIMYLHVVGLKRIKLILATGADTDLLEKIVRVLLSKNQELISNEPVGLCQVTHAESSTLAGSNDIESCEDKVKLAKSEIGAVTEDTIVDDDERDVLKEKVFDSMSLAKWIAAITEFDRFELFMRFAGPELMRDFSACLISAKESCSTATGAAKFEAALSRCLSK